MDRNTRHLVYRMTPLICGVFAHAPGPSGKRFVRFGGSGIFIAPFLAVSASHVCRDLFRTDPDQADLLRRRKGYLATPHSTGLFQVAPSRMSQSHAIWGVNRTWDPVVTDIAMMQVGADQGDAVRRQHSREMGFFEWSMLPPPIGAQVHMFGFPKTDMIVTEDDKIEGKVLYTIQTGTVRAVFEIKRESGMYKFPCFSIDKPVDHGFSGGPVIWEDRLCGIVSGGSIEEITYAATLWPLCLLEYEYPDQPAALGGKQTVADLFDKGIIRSPDWKRIKGRISRQLDSNGSPFAHLSC
jgi:hypothetical protein